MTGGPTPWDMCPQLIKPQLTGSGPQFDTSSEILLLSSIVHVTY